ncbi:hypothetical protein RIF29_09338 [Crotalaria pallida]|uniref:Uncharacterized protein n=1 Tax=Crotalaria pallida TaxID=3830 RepID=A0AAN9FRS6_CROPI
MTSYMCTTTLPNLVVRMSFLWLKFSLMKKFHQKKIKRAFPGLIPYLAICVIAFLEDRSIDHCVAARKGKDLQTFHYRARKGISFFDKIVKMPMYLPCPSLRRNRQPCWSSHYQLNLTQPPHITPTLPILRLDLATLPRSESKGTLQHGYSFERKV